VAAAHTRPHDLRASFPHGAISRRACYRFFRDTATGGRGDRSGLDVLLLALADSQAPGKASGAEASNDLAGIATLLDYGLAPETAARQPLVDGRRLMRALGLSPGQTVGFLLESIREAQAAGEVTTEEEALDLAAELLARRDG